MYIIPKSLIQLVTSGVVLSAATAANAHHAMDGRTPETFIEGFISGIAHPVIGIDHFVFLSVVALLAYSAGGRGRSVIPGAFAAATVLGTIIHLGSADLPMSEVVIALSVLLGGILVLSRVNLSTAVLSALVVSFGIFHGYAYGESIIGAEQTPLLAYLAGFAIVQYGLIVGFAVALTRLERHSEKASLLIGRGSGAFAAIVGGVFLAMNLG